MQVKKKLIDHYEDEYTSQKLERKIAFINKVRSGNRPYPKNHHQLISISEILEDLEYPLSAFPEAAILAALDRSEEITPHLLKILEDALINYDDDDEAQYMAPLFALFILSKFCEMRAFPLIVELARLSEETLDHMLGDTHTENLQQFFGSTYDGNFEKIKALIEDPHVCIWSRDAALRCLLVLFKAGVLERDFILSYLKDLFHHDSFVDDEVAMASLVCVACDIYPDEVYSEIKDAFEKDRVDITWVDLDDVDRTFTLGKEECLRRNIYESYHHDIITDVIKETSWWAYANETEAKTEKRNEIYDSSTPFKRELPKIGRNESCFCGSGKKYKKCCLV